MAWAMMRHAAERLLHPWRRRRARRRVRRREFPRHALVVCHGNIWRSPYAAAVLRRELAKGGRKSVHVTSAGLIGPGRPCPDAAIAYAAARGLDLTQHRSRLVVPADIAASDLILVMDQVQGRTLRAVHGCDSRTVQVLGDLDPGAIETRTIQDPYGQPPEVYEQTFTRIERCIGALVDALPPALTSQPAGGTV